MTDYIERDVAIKICNMPNYNIHDILFALKTIPGKMILAADVRDNVRGETIYGYDIKDLAVFAAACRQEGITESEMHDFCLNAGAAVEAVLHDMERVQKETFERFVHGFGADMRGGEKDG